MGMQGNQGYGYSRSPAWVLVVLLIIVAAVSIISSGASAPDDRSTTSPENPPASQPRNALPARPAAQEPLATLQAEQVQATRQALERQKKLDEIAVAQRAWRLADEQEKAAIAKAQARAVIVSQQEADQRAANEQAARITWMNAVVLIGAAATCVVFLLVVRRVILSCLEAQCKAEEARRQAEEAHIERIRKYKLVLEYRARQMEIEGQMSRTPAGSGQPKIDPDGHNEQTEEILWPEQQDWLDENYKNLPLAR